MIGLSTRTFDLAGAIIIRELPGESDLEVFERRLSKTATLDGGVVVEDRGYTHGDRTFTVVAPTSIALRDALSYLTQSYSELVVSTAGGVFLAHPLRCLVARERTTMILEVKELLGG